MSSFLPRDQLQTFLSRFDGPKSKGVWKELNWNIPNNAAGQGSALDGIDYDILPVGKYDYKLDARTSYFSIRRATLSFCDLTEEKGFVIRLPKNLKLRHIPSLPSTKSTQESEEHSEREEQSERGKKGNEEGVQGNSVGETQFKLSGDSEEVWNRCCTVGEAYFIERGSGKLPSKLTDIPSEEPVCPHPNGFVRSSATWREVQSSTGKKMIGCAECAKTEF